MKVFIFKIRVSIFWFFKNFSCFFDSRLDECLAVPWAILYDPASSGPYVSIFISKRWENKINEHLFHFVFERFFLQKKRFFSKLKKNSFVKIKSLGFENAGTGVRISIFRNFVNVNLILENLVKIFSEKWISCSTYAKSRFCKKPSNWPFQNYEGCFI